MPRDGGLGRDERGLAKGFNLFEMQDDDPIDISAKKYEKHILEIRACIEAECKAMLARNPGAFPDEIEVNADQCLGAFATVAVKQFYSVKNAMRGSGRILFPEVIRTAFKLYEAIYLHGHSHVVAYGGTNLGKTSCAHFLRFITGPLNALRSGGKPTCIINVYIPRKSVIEGAEATYNSLLELYGLIEFRFKNLRGPATHIGIKDCHDKIVKGFWAHAVEGKKKNEFNLSRTKKQIRQHAKKASALGVDLLTEIDEVHYAPRNDGQLGKKMDVLDANLASDVDDESDENGIGAASLEAIRQVVRNVVAFSATPDTNLVGPWVLVKMEYSKEYASTHQYFLGEKIADRVIPVWSFDRFKKESGIDLSVIDTRLLKRTATRSRAPEQQVRRMYAVALKALNWLYDNRPGGRKGNGSFVRLEGANDHAREFAEYVERRSDIKVLRYFGTDNKENIRDQLAKFIAEGVKFCVVPTAGCRMADDIPKEVEFFLDFTYKTTYYNAVRQSTAGRASGHGKNSLVILSNANASAVEYDNLLQGHYVSAPSQHSMLDAAAVRRRPPSLTRRRKLFIDFADPIWRGSVMQQIKFELEQLFQPVLELGYEKRIQLRLKPDSVKGLDPRVVFKERNWFFPVYEVFSQSRMDQLTKILARMALSQLEFLRPEDAVTDEARLANEHLACYQHLCAVSVGSANRGNKKGSAALGGSDHATRNKTSMQSGNKYTGGQRPEFLFEWIGGRFCLEVGSLPLRNEVVFVAQPQQKNAIVPRDHTWHHALNEAWEAAS